MNNFKSQILLLLDKNSLSYRTQVITISIILLSCLAVRLYTINAPMLDRTDWKEIDHIEISKNYYRNGYKFLEPEITWPAEPPRITAMEFPLVPYSAALLYGIFGFNVYTVRAITLCAFLLMSFYIYRLGKRELGPIVGILASLAACIMPLYHPFGRYLFSEPLMLALSVMSLYYFAEWVDFRKKRDWLLSTASFSLAAAVKVECLYLMLPLLWIAFRAYGFAIKRYTAILLMIFCSLLLPVAWYAYAYYLTQNYIDVFGIFQGHDKMQTLTMLSQFKWYRTMIYRLGRFILGGEIGTLLCMVGIVSCFLIRKGKLFLFYLIAVCIYFVLVAEGQIDTSYRQMNIIPAFAVFMGLGSVCLSSIVISFFKLRSFLVSRTVLIISSILITSLILFNFVKVFLPNPEEPVAPHILDLAHHIKKHTNANSLLIALGEYTRHKGGNDLSPLTYYYANRQGWTLQKGELNLKKIKELMDKGATHLIARNTSGEPELVQFVLYLKEHFKILYEDGTRDLLLLDLKTSVN